MSAPETGPREAVGVGNAVQFAALRLGAAEAILRSIDKILDPDGESSLDTVTLARHAMRDLAALTAERDRLLIIERDYNAMCDVLRKFRDGPFGGTLRE